MTREAKLEKMREWSRSHPEYWRERSLRPERREYERQWREAHKESIAARDKVRYLATREVASQQTKEARIREPEKFRARNRQWYARHSEDAKRAAKEYKQANPDKARIWSRKRDVKRRALLGSVICEAIDPVEIFERDKWRCKQCRRKTPREMMGRSDKRAPTLDHIVPLSLGGPHTRANLRCLCFSCNASKGAKYEGQLVFL